MKIIAYLMMAVGLLISFFSMLGVAIVLVGGFALIEYCIEKKKCEKKK